MTKEMPKEIWTHDFASGIDIVFNELPNIKYIRADFIPQWQPIETAPKDGTTIMLLRWSEQMPEVFSAWWMPLDKAFSCEEPEGHMWILNDDDHHMIEEDENLSIWYWMPLLEPPKED